MFKPKVSQKETNIIPLISFWLTFGVFLAITVRALFLKKSTVNHMENLPLEEDDDSTSQAASK